ncbi:hypothetical protein WA026_001231 [Henosepilachna vigintioctopunctata]|uniref:Uncharacterized protein n=1 Tax=Henosepilachna vigintioctopunctata TaxID=420089 RepID=A0AAW1UPB0_9CUCU
MESYANTTIKPSYFTPANTVIHHNEGYSNFENTSSERLDIEKNFTDIEYNNTRISEYQNIAEIKFEKLTNVRNYSGVFHNKTRKVTVNGINFIGSNNSWNKVDKSMLFMGERALNLDPKKKNKTDAGTVKRVPELGEDFSEEESVNERISSDEAVEMAKTGHVDIVTRFLRIVESQHLLGENCTAGTDLNLGDGVVDRYAQERFRVEADVAVNRANMLTRLWKYAGKDVVNSEYLLHASLFSMVEFDDDIFAAGNCYDQHQYKDYQLFCPYAYRLPEGSILVKDLAVEYKYLSNTSEWFYIARKNAEKVIKNFNQFRREQDIRSDGREINRKQIKYYNQNEI